MSQTRHAGVILGLCVMCAVLILSATHTFTQDAIERTRYKTLMSNLSAVLPDGPYDNNPVSSAHMLESSALDTVKPTRVYPVYKQGAPYAAVLTLHTTHGYNGSIRLLLGVTAQGVITGARVIEHAETPGLGDDIDLHHSSWIMAFDHLSLHNTSNTDWAVKAQGGQFDAFTGASITPRAVIEAIHRALVWFRAHPQEVFTP